MFMKIVKAIGWIIAGVVALIAALILYITISWSGIFLPNPRMPEITYAEFPLRIEIEYDGERLVFEDAIICEYDGFGVSGYGTAKNRRWKERFASGKEYQASYPTIVLLDTDDVLIKYHSGEGAYYMDIPYYEIGDEYEDGTPYTPSSPSIYVEDKNLRAKGEFSFNFYDVTPQQEPRYRNALKHYGVEIISIEQKPPIVNTFR